MLDPWQAQFLEDALGENDDRWAATEVGLVCPRQNGKGAILEARELAGLYLFGERLILHSAHEFKTASEAYRRIRFLVESTPDLDRRVFKMLQNNNDMSIELKGGARLRFVARTGGSGRGFSGDCVILDEAMTLSSEAVAALLPTLSARPNPQIWYTGSAPYQTEPSQVLRDLCRRGRRGSPKLAYVEYSAALEADPTNLGAWAEANPALGIRVTEEWIALEQVALGDEFARERLGHWDDNETGSDRVIPRHDWAACAFPSSDAGSRLSFALDVSKDRQWSSFGVAGEHGHVELVERERGTDWVTTRAQVLQGRWKGPLAISAGSPASSLLPELEMAGVNVVEVSTTDHAKACGAFYDAAVQHTLRHLDQVELNVAIEGAERKFSGDAWLWSRRTSSVDISPLVAVTLAKWVFDHGPTAMPWMVVQ